MANLPRVALVGRPNVGKSTLFNRLIGKRQAVVSDIAGTTRDRIDHPLSWGGRSFVLTDMAGLEPFLTVKTEINQGMQRQIDMAMQAADVVIWVVDASAEIQPVDEHVALLLRELHKPVVIAANKCDNPKHDIWQYEFARFGFESIAALSAIHGRGINDLLDAVVAALPEARAMSQDEHELKLAIAGRPNVGKSTLLNAITREERSVVSAVAGTTRDAVDTVIPASELFGRVFTQWKRIRIIDTAGMRRRGKIEQGIEEWSIIRTLDAVDQAEVVLFMIDASEGMVHQDLQVAQKITDAGKALILLVNKWDIVLDMKDTIAGTPEDAAAQDTFLNHLRTEAPFLHWAQVLFLSAATGLNLHVIGKVVVNAYNSWNLSIDQAELDELVEHLRTKPRLKNLQRITLEHAKPPVFHIHVEGKRLPHFSTHRMLENTLRDYFQIGPTPIKIWSVPSIQQRKH